MSSEKWVPKGTFICDNKLVKSFEKAIDNAHGGVRLSQIGDDEDENVDFLDEKRYNKVGGKYSQYRSLAMQWVKATNTKKGSTKLLYNPDNDTWNLICADNSEMGYSEIITYSASSKNVEAVMVEDGENGSYTEKQKNGSSIYESAEVYRAESSIKSDDNTYDANQGADGRDGAFYSGKSSSNRNGNIGKSKGNSRLSKKKLIRIRFDDGGNVIEEIRRSKAVLTILRKMLTTRVISGPRKKTPKK